MKQDIHPTYSKTTVTCNGCKNTFETKATVEAIEVEICSNCHPFYTGKQKLVDVAGRVDQFRARQAAAQARKPKAKPAQKAKPAKKAKPDTETAAKSETDTKVEKSAQPAETKTDPKQ